MKKIEIKKTEFKKLFNIACDGWKTKFNTKFAEFSFNDTLSFEESYLQEMKNACDQKQLKVFNSIFSKFLKEEDNLFNVSKYSEVYKRLKEPELTESDFSFLLEEDRKKACAQAQIKQLERFYNGDWRIDWKDRNQPKYYPYFNTLESGGLRFYDSDFYCDSFHGTAGFYKDKKTSDFIGNNYKEIYENLI